MTVINDSYANCGMCGEKIKLIWDIIDIDVDINRPMGESTTYYCEAITECKCCGKEARVGMKFCEYPVGGIEGIPEIELYNDKIPLTENVDIPIIYFVDL